MRYNRVSSISMSGKSMKKLSSEKGMASFLIVMILMVIITLIILGFSQVTRRNAREALDRQLSTQAFYAAESGINATTAAIRSYVTASGFSAMPSKTSCQHDYDPTQPGGVGAAITDLGSATRYTCVLVNPNPTTLKYDTSQQNSTIVPMNTSGNLTTLKFQWNVQAGGVDTTCTGANARVFPQPPAWNCDFGILRVDLVDDPVANLGNLPLNTITMYLTPLGTHSGTLAVPNFTGDKAYVASASGCSTGICSVTITFAGPASSSSYYARVSTIYRDAPITISGTIGAAPATFSGSQAIVDTTGQAQDELRRVQVRVALTSTPDPGSIPANALSSGADICKRFTILPTDSIDLANLCGGTGG